MGIIGILPSVANHFDVSVSKAGLLVSVFALTVSICGLIMPLLFSGVNRKKAMLLVLGIFILSNIVSLFTTNFTIAVLARVIPAIFHLIYFSAAFTVAANLGTTMGTAVGGLFIAGLGTQYILLVGVLSLLLSLPFILLRNYMYNPIKQLSK